MATPPKNRRRGQTSASATATTTADGPKSRLHACIASLTRSGETKLDDCLLRELKQLCRSDDQLIDLAYALLTRCLVEAHAQVRYSAFQIVDQLFRRSRRFRCLVLDRFEKLVDCVLTDNEAKDPPPKPVSVFRQLGDLALEAFIAWHDQFNGEHPKLVFAFRYLSEAHSARLRKVRERLAQSEAARQSSARQLAAKKRELLADTRRQLGEDEAELSACLATVANCLALLVPSPEEFDVNRLTTDRIGEVPDVEDDATSTTADDEADDDEQRRLHGIVGRPGASQSVLSLRLCRPCVRQTSDNAELIEALVSRTEQLRRRMRPRLARWLAVVERCASNPAVEGVADASAAVDENEVLRLRLTELLAEADRLLGQVARLEIVRGEEATDATVTGSAADIDDDESIGHDDGNDDDDDFERVNKEGFETEAVTSSSTSVSNSVVRSFTSSIPKAAPASSASSASAAAPSSSAKSAGTGTSSGIPIVPFGIDLANWGSAEIATFGYRPDDGGHSLGYRPLDGDAEFEIQGSRTMLTMRTMIFQTPDKPLVSRACRHPLPDGAGLCQRMDRVKCPFHGRIVPRDESGRPDGEDLTAAAVADPSPPSADNKKGKRRRKSDVAADKSSTGGGAAGLVDLRALEENSRTRLAARVASKAALRRVEAAESARRRRKMEEKFGDHFQYQFMN